MTAPPLHNCDNWTPFLISLQGYITSPPGCIFFIAVFVQISLPAQLIIKINHWLKRNITCPTIITFITTTQKKKENPKGPVWRCHLQPWETIVLEKELL